MVLSLKYLSLSVLVLQTTVLVLVLRYSRSVPQSGPRYLASTTVVISDLLKLVTCILILCHESSWSIKLLTKVLHDEVWRKRRETLKLILPAGLYTIQNNLLFLALTILDAATYQVIYQMKVLTTAMFSVILLHKKLEPAQWFALVLLMIGITLVEMPSTYVTGSLSVEPNVPRHFLGIFVVILASFSSGFSGVYFEKLLKSSTQSLWIRNVQLALFSILLGVLPLLSDLPAIMEDGFFQGYYMTTWIVIVLQAFGGLVVSTVIKYADNILKGFATSVSIILSTFFSYYILDDFKFSKKFFIGASIVTVATMLYGYPVKKTSIFVNNIKVPDSKSKK